MERNGRLETLFKTKQKHLQILRKGGEKESKGLCTISKGKKEHKLGRSELDEQLAAGGTVVLRQMKTATDGVQKEA